MRICYQRTSKQDTTPAHWCLSWVTWNGSGFAFFIHGKPTWSRKHSTAALDFLEERYSGHFYAKRRNIRFEPANEMGAS